MSGDRPIEVLVVDDDDLVRKMLVKVLERRGFVTHAAADGRSALAMLGELDVDVVLLDQGLPDISGAEVLASLRASPETATLPVILVTGQADIEARVGGLQAGADDYLVKPVNMDELVARVHAQIRGRDAWRSQVQDKLHERAQLAGALAAVTTSEDPVAVAAAVVAVLRRVPDVRRIRVLGLSGDRHVQLIASSEFDVAHPVAPRPEFDPLVMAELRQVVARGAVLLPSVLAHAVFEGTQNEVVALGAEIGGRVVAVVALETDGGSDDRHGASLDVLSAAIDLSPIVERVLSPAFESSRGDVSVATRLRAVIEGMEFHPVYQPLVELSTGRIRGFEALTRFDDGVPPDQRFAEASHAGLGADLELATLGRALEVGERLPPECYLSVNVSATLLTGHGLDAVLDKANGRPLVLELTEHERIDDYVAVREAVGGLHREVRLSVDDAGSGWASMRHVFALTPDFVKLDRLWVSQIHSDRARQALLLGMARFVSELGGVLVAEGIETHRELATLKSLGIEWGQGYLLGRPSPVETYEHIDCSKDVSAGLPPSDADPAPDPVARLDG